MRKTDDPICSSSPLHDWAETVSTSQVDKSLSLVPLHSLSRTQSTRKGDAQEAVPQGVFGCSR